MTKDILYLCDENDIVQAVQLSLAAWNKVEAVVRPILEPAGQGPAAADGTQPALPPEPLGDWEQLVQYWDYKYPVNRAVECSICGARTDDWLADEPRTFWLRAATFGGLVAYHCMGCKARVNKKLFKKEIVYDATPYFEKKDDRFIGMYGADRK